RGKEGRVWPAVPHGYTETLGRTEYHIGAQFTGRSKQHQTQRIHRYTGQTLLRLYLLDQWLQVAYLAPGGGVLKHRAEYLVLLQHIDGIHQQLETEGLGAGAYHRDGLRMAIFIDEEDITLALGYSPRQRHGLRRRG